MSNFVRRYKKPFALLVALVTLAGSMQIYSIFSPTKVAYAETITLFITDTGLTTWEVPSDWSDTNTISVIAGGGGGAAGGDEISGGGGGGGAHAVVTDLTGLSPSDTIDISIGAGGTAGNAGGDTWFNGSSCATSSVCAKGGQGGTASGENAGGGDGGAATGGVGTQTAGGDGGDMGAGGNRPAGSGGGGGAAGPDGAGVAGQAGQGGAGGGGAGTKSGDGGAGNGGTVNGGGAGGTGGDHGNPGVAGTAGGSGTHWESSLSVTSGAGGGGGGGGSGDGPNRDGGAGAPGGDYGAGGGGGGASVGNGTPGSGGTGVQGVIFISYMSFSEPEVSSAAASSVTDTAATLNGTITDTGGFTGAGTQHGFVWGTNASLSGGDTATTTLGTYSGTGSFSDSLSGLNSNTTYYFRAYATNDVGTGYGDILNFLTLPGTPGTPTFTAVSDTTLTVNWAAPSGGAASYKVERCTGASCDTFTQIAAGVTSTSYDDSGLSDGTTYRYRVRATNDTGDSAYSAIGDVTTQVTTPTDDSVNNVKLQNSTIKFVNGRIIVQ